MRSVLLTTLLAAGLGYGLAGLAAGDGDSPYGQDLREAATRTLRLPPSVERVEALLALTERVRAADVPTLSRLLESDDFIVDACDVRPLTRALLEVAPTETLRSIPSWTVTGRAQWGFEEVGRWLALTQGIEPAREFARNRTLPVNQNAVLSGLVSAWADVGDLRTLAPYLESMPDGGKRGPLIDHLARALVRRHGIEGAMSWVDALPEDDSPDGLARNIFLLVLRFATITSPKLGKTWYEDNADSVRARGALGIVAAEWVEHDPSAASAWLLGHPDTPDARASVSSAVLRWLEIDPDGVEDWLDAHRDRPLAMASANQLVRNLAPRRPLDAIEWTKAIDDANMRARALGLAVRTWLENDPEAARAWIASADDLPMIARRVIGEEAEK